MTHKAWITTVWAQTPPSHEEKQSGELGQISWASTHSCECHLATFKTFYTKPAKKCKDTRVEIKNCYYCKGSTIYVIITNLAISFVLTTFREYAQEKLDFVHSRPFLTRKHAWSGHETRITSSILKLGS